MEQNLFNELLESVQEASDISCGEATGKTTVISNNIEAVYDPETSSYYITHRSTGNELALTEHDMKTLLDVFGDKNE